MARYSIQRRHAEPAPEIRDEDVITIKEAAELLGISIQAVSQALDAGRLTTVVNGHAEHARHGRRKVLRAEIEKYGRQ